MTGFSTFDKKVAVVTGGASGIGKGIAKQLRRQGMHVVIADIEDAALKSTAEEIGAVAICTDVTDPSSVEGLAAQTVDRFGAVHVVCNNAGVGSMARLDQMTLQDWKWVIDVNLWGVIHGVTTFLPWLKKNIEGGHIVNTASIGGMSTFAGLGAYAVTKFGVVALTEQLAIELALEGSRVGATVLCPGPVKTNIGASSRNRPAKLTGGLVDVDIENSEIGAGLRWIEPERVGAIVVKAIREGDLYAFTHPEHAPQILERQQAIATALERTRDPDATVWLE